MTGTDHNAGRLLAIGLDGATWDLLRPLSEKGLLPNIDRLVAEGAHGRLRSVVPPITGPAWSSFMTGKNPGKHSVFEFIKKGGSGQDRPINSSDVRSETLWEILSRSGKKVVVVNVPVTYPPRPVDGVLIADFLTPAGRTDFGYPAGVVEELEERFGSYRLHIKEVYAPGRVGNVIEELFDALEFRLKSALYLMREKPWDFFMVHIFGTDRVQHELWHVMDENHPAHDRVEAAEWRPRIEEYFRKVDEAVGELVSAAGGDTPVFIVSDHGFGPIDKFVSFNVWLLKEGFLKIKRTPLSMLKYLIFRLGLTPALGYRVAMRIGLAKLRLSMGFSNRVGILGIVNRLFLSFKDVDWSRTVAYSKGNYGQMFVNLKGREPGGIVEPGEEYEKVLSRLVEKLGSIRDPETGEGFIGSIFRREELYSGPYSQESPDLTFLMADMRNKPAGTVEFISNRFVEPTYGNSGDHRMDGIFIARGGGVGKGVEVEGASIVDLAPTILYTMGQKVPDDMDGRVIAGAFEESFIAGRPVEFTEPGGMGGPAEEVSFDAEENEEVAERLRNMGYLG